jgi:hypothetical protein
MRQRPRTRKEGDLEAQVWRGGSSSGRVEEGRVGQESSISRMRDGEGGILDQHLLQLGIFTGQMGGCLCRISMAQ